MKLYKKICKSGLKFLFNFEVVVPRIKQLTQRRHRVVLMNNLYLDKYLISATEP